VNHRQRNAQLLGDSLAELRADVLAHFDLSRVNGNATILVDMNPGPDVVRNAPVGSPSSGFALPLLRLLRQQICKRDNQSDATAKDFNEWPSIESKTIGGFGKQLVAIDLDNFVVILLVAHFAISFGLPEAISIAATIRW